MRSASSGVERYLEPMTERLRPRVLWTARSRRFDRF